MDRERDGLGFFIAPGLPETALWLYPERQFERIAEQAKSSFIPQRDQLKWEQMFYTLADHVEPDSQGRVIVPPRMLSCARLGRDVVICGVRDHLEIRRRDEFEKDLERSWAAYQEYVGRVQDGLQQEVRQTDQAGR